MPVFLIFTTMRIHFIKYQGTGNDFIIIDGKHGSPMLSHEQVRALCDRRFGIGADGLMLFEPDDVYDFRMVYYNSDGNPSTMCGNGGRCLVRFGRSKGYIQDKTRFVAADGPHEAVCNSDGTVSLKMSDVPVISDDACGCTFLDTGSPHVVRWVDEVDQVDVVEEGRAIRYNAVYNAEGTNVNFVQVVGDGIRVRTYERGVEDETLSCGTGVTAAVLASDFRAKVISAQNCMRVSTPGGNLQVRFQRDGNGYKEIWLEGPAEAVFEGSIDI